MHGRFGNLLIFAAVAMVAYLSVSMAAQGPLIVDGLKRLSAAGVLLVLCLSMLNYILRFLRWHWFLGQVGPRPPMPRHFLYYLSGFSLTVSPGKAGEAVRSWFLKPYGVSMATSLGALFVERLLDLSAVALLATFVVSLKPEYCPAIAVVAALIVVALALVASGRLRQLLGFMASKLPDKLAKVAGHAEELLRGARGMLSMRRLSLGLAIGLIAWGGEGLGFYFIAHSLGVELSLGVAVGIYAMGALGGVAAFFMPGGLGGTEVALTGLLLLVGATAPVALAITILCRLATLWFAVVVGLVALGILRMRVQLVEVK